MDFLLLEVNQEEEDLNQRSVKLKVHSLVMLEDRILISQIIITTVSTIITPLMVVEVQNLKLVILNCLSISLLVVMVITIKDREL